MNSGKKQKKFPTRKELLDKVESLIQHHKLKNLWYDRKIAELERKVEAYRKGWIEEIQLMIDCDELKLTVSPSKYVDAEAERLMKENRVT